MLTEYTYVFAIGTFFALLEAYNNGASMLLRSTFRSLSTSTD
jgi:sodium-dependent phosphate transporter